MMLKMKFTFLNFQSLGLLFLVFLLTQNVVRAQGSQNVPSKFVVKNNKCPARYRDPKTKNSKFANLNVTIPLNSEATLIKPVNTAKKQFVLIKFPKTQALSNYEILADYKCLTQAKSNLKMDLNKAESQSDLSSRTSKNHSSSLKIFLDGGLIRERTDFLETANQRLEPLFNDIIAGSLGVDYELHLGSAPGWLSHSWGAQTSLIFGLASVKNADATPYTVVSQTGTLALGLGATPYFRSLYGDAGNFQIGLQVGFPLILRYQSFGTSTSGAITANQLGFLWGTEFSLYSNFGNGLSAQIGYGGLSFSFATSPIIKAGLAYAL